MNFNDIKNNKEINAYIQYADDYLKAIGYTEHSFIHIMRCVVVVEDILKSLGYDTSKPATYFLLSDGSSNVLNVEDGHYTFMAYYFESNYLLVVDFEIVK